ncbi:MAG: glycoside hydrolase 100 family protein [Pseudomonadota bacterium]|nr:glycoside hydrolase 100 family protein [Pseudomonadota bacterium]
MQAKSTTGGVNSDTTSVEGYNKALALLHACVTADGFVATPSKHSKHSNYHRIWGRDGAIIALAALLTNDEELVHVAKKTFETLAKHHGPHGEIPSNVDPASGRISYGGTTGRVDADLWFIIGCGEYWCATGDQDFLEDLLPVIEKVRFLLGAWEFNNRGLIYVPLTGDWADEYLHNGYVLYDQLLYLQAQRTLARIHAAVHGSSDHVLNEKISHLRHLIRTNYWFNGDGVSDDVYHEVLYRKGLKAAEHCAGRHWMASFSPSGYGYRFDAFANVLASLLDVADDEQRDNVDTFIAEELANDELPLLPAFHPVIKPVDQDWESLQVMFSYTFKNKPYEFHNGGLWPMVTGFYVADLAWRKHTEHARKLLQAIHNANAMAMEDEAWGFPEFVHGKDFTPGGTRHQGWSAAGAIIGHHALDGQRIFRIDDHES